MIKRKSLLYTTLSIMLIYVVVSMILVKANGVRAEIKKVDDIEARYFEGNL